MVKSKPRIVEIKNKKAEFENFLENRYTAGLVLTGPEVKSIRVGNASISEAFCLIDGKFVIIRGMYIAEFKNAGYTLQQPLRDKKLLLNKLERKKIEQKMKEKGYTLIPVKLFFAENGIAKIEIALAKGKKNYDKREDIKEKDIKRDIERYA